MIPGPGVTVIEAVCKAAEPGVTEADVIRWVGVVAAVFGAVLATPEGIALAWRSVKNWHRKVWARGRRWLRRPGHVSRTGAAGTATMTGKASPHPWQDWVAGARADVKIDILHRQVDFLLEQIGKLRRQIDRTGDDLRNVRREAEGRVQQLASEMRGERSQASRVDARGIGPIALGIILTGVPDGLAAAAPVGWLAIAVAVVWIVAAAPSWLRDYRRALKHNDLCGRGPRRNGTPRTSGRWSAAPQPPGATASRSLVTLAGPFFVTRGVTYAAAPAGHGKNDGTPAPPRPAGTWTGWTQPDALDSDHFLYVSLTDFAPPAKMRR